MSGIDAMPVGFEAWTIHDTPTPRYQAWVTEQLAWLDGTEWGYVMSRGFHAKRRYLWNDAWQCGISATVFQRGPARVAYLGFPLCLPVGFPPQACIDGAVATLRSSGRSPQLTRIPLSAFSEVVLCARARQHQLPESCETRLQDWDVRGTSERRRYLSKAQRRCADLERVADLSGMEMFGLYRDMLTRHRGRSRYTLAYFEGLAAIAKNGIVRIHALRDAEGPVSMIVTARHGPVELYLHGGTRSDATALGASDLLMAAAMTDARDRNASAFNFLQSPGDQPGLIRFKEKWGGTTRTSHTAELAYGLLGQLIQRLL